jgi:hypothetical protein
MQSFAIQVDGKKIGVAMLGQSKVSILIEGVDSPAREFGVYINNRPIGLVTRGEHTFSLTQQPRSVRVRCFDRFTRDVGAWSYVAPKSTLLWWVILLGGICGAAYAASVHTLHTVISPEANLRASASLEGEIVRTLPAGTGFFSLYRIEDFHRVVLFDGTSGYIHSRVAARKAIFDEALRNEPLASAKAEQPPKAVLDSIMLSNAVLACDLQGAMDRSDRLGTIEVDETDLARSKFFWFQALLAEERKDDQAATLFYRAVALANPNNAEAFHKWGSTLLDRDQVIDWLSAVHSVRISPDKTASWIMIAGGLSGKTPSHLTTVTCAVEQAHKVSTDLNKTKRWFANYSAKHPQSYLSKVLRQLRI